MDAFSKTSIGVLANFTTTTTADWPMSPSCTKFKNKNKTTWKQNTKRNPNTNNATNSQHNLGTNDPSDDVRTCLTGISCYFLFLLHSFSIANWLLALSLCGHVFLLRNRIADDDAAFELQWFTNFIDDDDDNGYDDSTSVSSSPCSLTHSDDSTDDDWVIFTLLKISAIFIIFILPSFKRQAFTMCSCLLFFIYKHFCSVRSSHSSHSWSLLSADIWWFS